jgi:hypothetical protein
MRPRYIGGRVVNTVADDTSSTLMNVGPDDVVSNFLFGQFSLAAQRANQLSVALLNDRT